MIEKPETKRWEMGQRLEFIEFRVFWEGGINRSDLIAKFGISVPQASADLARYQALAPNNLSYDTSEKRYVAGPGFQPQFYQPNAERYLAQTRAISDEIMALGDSWMTGLPCVDALSVRQKPVSPAVLSKLMQAVRGQKSVEIDYQSLSSDNPERSIRRISPHAFCFDGERWHIRAFCHRKNEFRTFSLARCYAADNLGEAANNTGEDKAWTSRFEVELIPNPKLSPTQRQVLAEDYCMTDGCLLVSVREAMMLFFHVRMRLDRQPDDSAPKKTPLVVRNRTEYEVMATRLKIL